MLTESFLQQKNKCQALITNAQTMALKSDYTRAFNSLNDAMHTCKGSYSQIARAQYSKISSQKDFDEKLEKKTLISIQKKHSYTKKRVAVLSTTLL